MSAFHPLRTLRCDGVCIPDAVAIEQEGLHDPEGTNTRVVMEQDGFRGLKGFMISRILGSGWRRMVATRLPAAVGRVRDGVYLPDPTSPDSQCHK